MWAGANKTDTWRTGIVDCCSDIGSCLDASFFFQCMFGYQGHVLLELSTEPGMSCKICITCEANPWAVRHAARERYSIAENDCSALCVPCFCMPCSMAQVHREMGLRGEFPGGCCSHAPDGVPQQIQDLKKLSAERAQLVASQRPAVPLPVQGQYVQAPVQLWVPAGAHAPYPPPGAYPAQPYPYGGHAQPPPPQHYPQRA